MTKTSHSHGPSALSVRPLRNLCLLKTPKDRERLEILRHRCVCSKLRRTEKGWRFLHHGPTVAGMITFLSTVISILGFRLRRRASLELELIALRHQVSVLRRQRPCRLRLFSTDRLLWVWLYRVWPRVLNAMVLVKPATVIQWHRKGFQLHWRWRSRRLGRPKVNTEIRDLIRRMSLANPLWGAPRIHGELLKLGIDVSQATVGRHMPWRPKVPSPTWRSFLCRTT
jgi:putative transposase